MIKIKIFFFIVISQSLTWAIHCATPFKNLNSLVPHQSTANTQIIGPTFLAFEYPGKNEFDLDKVFKSEHFSIHYTLKDSAAVSDVDLNSNFIPDLVDTIAIELEKIWSLYISDDLWNAPPLDVEGFYHVYLSDINSSYYGYVEPYQSIGDNPATPEKETNAYESFMVLRNSYENFADPKEALLATLAHEFLHSIQFGYDAYEEKWLLEGQATSMEGWVYPDSKDNFQFVQTWFEFHDASFVYDSFILNENSDWDQLVYSIWPFFYELYVNYGGLAIGAEITKGSLIKNSQYLNSGLTALNKALENYGTNFKTEFKNYALNAFLINSDLEGPVPFSLKDTFRKNIDLKLSNDAYLKISEPPYLYKSSDVSYYLRGSGFDLIEIEFAKASALNFKTENLKKNIQIIVLDTLKGIDLKEYNFSEENTIITIDSSMIGRPLQFFIFNFDQSSINLDYEIDFFPISPRLNQFCLNDENEFNCGSLYNLKGQRLTTETSDFLNHQEGYYLQKKGSNNRPLIFK